MSNPMSNERWEEIECHISGGGLIRNGAAAELFDECKRLRAELAETMQESFHRMAELSKHDGEFEGWYDTMHNSTAMSLGDSLVEMGLYERHTQGSGGRQWYRPLREAPLFEEEFAEGEHTSAHGQKTMFACKCGYVTPSVEARCCKCKKAIPSAGLSLMEALGYENRKELDADMTEEAKEPKEFHHRTAWTCPDCGSTPQYGTVCRKCGREML